MDPVIPETEKNQTVPPPTVVVQQPNYAGPNNPLQQQQQWSSQLGPGQGQGQAQSPPIIQQPMGGIYYGQPQVRMQTQPMLGNVPPLVFLPPPPIPGVPAGLEYLLGLNILFVKQQIELMELAANIEMPNQYDIVNRNGQRIYHAGETTGMCTLMCGGSLRPFQINITDPFGRNVLLLDRPCSFCLYISKLPCCCCWFGTIGGSMNITLPDGTPFGEVVHVYNYCKPKYNILDATGTVVMVIDGPNCGDCFGAAPCGAADFPITTTNGAELGFIRKTFSGFFQEMFTDADNFGVEFPADMDVKWKALILASTFLIDFMYFESTPERGHYHHHYMF